MPCVKSQRPLVDVPAGMCENKYKCHRLQFIEYQKKVKTFDALKVIPFTRQHSGNLYIWRATLESHFHANNIDFA